MTLLALAAILEAIFLRIALPGDLKPRIVETIGQAKIALSGDSVGLLQAMEALALGVTGKKLLWRALRTVEAELSQLQGIDLSRLEQRAADQFERVEKERLHLSREAFTNEEKI